MYILFNFQFRLNSYLDFSDIRDILVQAHASNKSVKSVNCLFSQNPTESVIAILDILSHFGRLEELFATTAESTILAATDLVPILTRMKPRLSLLRMASYIFTVTCLFLFFPGLNI